jgi:hypothetical protein
VELSGRTIAIDADYFKDFDLERVVPQPRAQRAQDGEFVFEFDSDGAPYTVRFYLTPGDPLGQTSTTLRAGDTRIGLSFFTFP